MTSSNFFHLSSFLKYFNSEQVEIPVLLWLIVISFLLLATVKYLDLDLVVCFFITHKIGA